MRTTLSSVIVFMLFTANAPAQDFSSLSLVTSEEYGAYIVGPDARPVYVLLSSRGVGGDGLDPLESCAEGCREDWPPVTVQGDIRVDDQIDAALVDSTADGGQQVLTIADQPLFQFHRDAPGAEPEGQGIYSYGGYWALLTPFGRPIRTGAMPEAEEVPEEARDNGATARPSAPSAKE